MLVAVAVWLCSGTMRHSMNAIAYTFGCRSRRPHTDGKEETAEDLGFAHFQTD